MPVSDFVNAMLDPRLRSARNDRSAQDSFPANDHRATVYTTAPGVAIHPAQGPIPHSPKGDNGKGAQSQPSLHARVQNGKLPHPYNENMLVSVCNDDQKKQKLSADKHGLKCAQCVPVTVLFVSQLQEVALTLTSP